MSAAFFKRYFFTVSGLIVVICLFVATVFSTKNNDKESPYSVYYLIWETDSVQAGSATVEVQGGAGFCMQDGVAIDVYFSYVEAQRAKSSLESDKEKERVVLQEYKFDTHVSSVIVTGLRHIKGWQAALQNGAKQSVVRTGLQEIAKTLAFYSKESKDVQAGRIAKELQTLTVGVIYVQELRYFLCDVCETMVEAGEII